MSQTQGHNHGEGGEQLSHDHGVDLPIGGRADVCGICGEPAVIEDALIGLNGVICLSCRQNIVHFSPGYYAIRGCGYTNSLELYEYVGYPESPFWNSEVGCLVLDAPDAVGDPVVMREFYRGLSDTAKEMIWTVPFEEVPEGYTRVEPVWAAEYRPHEIMLSGAGLGQTDTDDHPMSTLDQLLPKPYVIDGYELVVQSEIPDAAKRLMETSVDDKETDAGQYTVSEFGNSGGDVDSQAKNQIDGQTDAKTNADDGESDTGIQSGLGAF